MRRQFKNVLVRILVVDDSSNGEISFEYVSRTARYTHSSHIIREADLATKFFVTAKGYATRKEFA